MNKNNVRAICILFLLIVFLHKPAAQFYVYPDRNITVKSYSDNVRLYITKGWVNSDTVLEIKNTLNPEDTFYSRFQNEFELTDSGYCFKYHTKFIDCRFEKYDSSSKSMFSNLPLPVFTNGFSIEGCIATGYLDMNNGGWLTGYSKSVTVFNSDIPMLSIMNHKVNSINIRSLNLHSIKYNILNPNVFLGWCECNEINVGQCVLEQLTIQSCSVKKLDIGLNNMITPNQTILLSKDTIGERLYIGNNFYYAFPNALPSLPLFSIISKDNAPSFNLEKCVLNCTLSAEHSRIPKITFNECRFQEGFSFEDAAIASFSMDTLIFRNCRQITQEIDLSQFVNSNIAEGIGNFRSRILYVCLTGSDVDKFEFSYVGGIKLLFDSADNYDQKYRVYNILLGKFKREGKDKSFENLDVEFQEFIYQNGSIGFQLIGYVDKIFWNYRHSKLLPVMWLVITLVLFTIYNLSHWKEMSETYNYDEDKITLEEDSFPSLKFSVHSIKNKLYIQHFFKNLYRVFIYTCLIFFSIRIAKDQINFRNYKYVTAFLIQHVLGILLLVFIARFLINF